MKKPKQKYRMLRIGERIREGDEFNDPSERDNEWGQVWGSVGSKVRRVDAGYFRRPITNEKANR